MLLSSFSMIVDVKQVSVIVDENDKVVCFGLTIPSIGKIMTKSKGHLTISALIQILKTKKNPEILDFGLIGVLPEYKNKGVATALFNIVMKMLAFPSVKYAETNLTLENNHAINNQMKIFKAIQHKRRRSFVKKI